MFKKSLNVRNITEALYFELVESAKKNGRSLEGEVRFILQEWSKAQTDKGLHKAFNLNITERMQELLPRLDLAFSNFNQIEPIPYSILAESLDLEYIDPVYHWFNGTQEPSRSNIRNMAHLLGCQYEWLMHGLGECYKFYAFTMHDSPIDFAKKLLKPNLLKNSSQVLYDQVLYIHFIRSESNGFVYIIKESEKYLCKVYFTSNLSLSSETLSDDEGAYNLAKFTLVLEALHKIRKNVIIKSYTISDPHYSDIFVKKQKHPLLFKQFATELVWHEDLFTDISIEPWKGFKTLRQRINTMINDLDELRDYRKQIEEV
ncbi:hypothetical protein RYD26_05325 [Pasteurellaceae bacterium LIM206]|nr:hypothetical protein [Pasteurellaceae bacterium LIM206]